MVFAIIDEEARRKSMIRCPRFEECESCLCPLDPYLKQAVFVPGKPLCYWFELFQRHVDMTPVPHLIAHSLIDYTLHLFDLGVLVGFEVEKPTRGFRG